MTTVHCPLRLHETAGPEPREDTEGPAGAAVVPTRFCPTRDRGGPKRLMDCHALIRASAAEKRLPAVFWWSRGSAVFGVPREAALLAGCSPRMHPLLFADP